MGFSSSTFAISTGPKSLTVVRIGTPSPCPPRVKNSVGAARETHSWPRAAARAVSFSEASPGTAIPERSPFMSATNTAAPAWAACSAMTWRVRVLPVPVAPAIRPWRFSIETARFTGTLGSGSSPSSIAPRWIRAPSKP